MIDLYQEAPEMVAEKRTRRLWLAVRRALLLIVAAIEREFGVDS